MTEIEEILNSGDLRWFEYHCFESDKSSDAKLWHHSHQKATIIGIAPNDGMEIHTQKERIECGQPIYYNIRFADGFKSIAAEDELMKSKIDFYRPNPQKTSKKEMKKERT
jgi:hypothetical protein